MANSSHRFTLRAFFAVPTQPSAPGVLPSRARPGDDAKAGFQRVNPSGGIMNQKSTINHPVQTSLEFWPLSQTHPIGRSLLVNAAVAGLGTAAGVAALAELGQLVHQPLLAAHVGATVALAFVPDSPLSRSRAIISSHVVAASVGLLCATLLAVALTLLTRTFHASAGATPLVVMATHPDADFLFAPTLAGASLLVVATWAYRSLIPRRTWW